MHPLHRNLRLLILLGNLIPITGTLSSKLLNLNRALLKAWHPFPAPMLLYLPLVNSRFWIIFQHFWPLYPAIVYSRMVAIGIVLLGGLEETASLALLLGVGYCCYWTQEVPWAAE